MHPSLKALEHRPWPLPVGQWLWRQAWLDLAFVHYRVASKKLASLIPSGLQLQEFDGIAWIGLVPFKMSGVMRRPLPDVPLFSRFPELNVRTYVMMDGKPGVWFFSLDAASLPVVLGGRHLYGLPYFYARMRHHWAHGWCHFSSTRWQNSTRFVARYRPSGEVFRAQPGSFEHWATERYCLYSLNKAGGIARVDVHHVPWPLQKAEIAIEQCELLTAAGINPHSNDPVVHFSSGVEVISFARENIRGSSALTPLVPASSLADSSEGR
jgi:uncharacterized protein